MRLPVFLGRRPAEPVDHDLAAFYGRLLKATNRDLFRNGEWRLCERSGWPDNQSCQNILAWCWVKDDERALVVVNYRAGTRPGSCACAVGRAASQTVAPRRWAVR